MKKIIALFIVAISLTASAQKKDSAKTQQYDTVVVLSVQDAESIANILLDSNVVIAGKQLSAKEVMNIISWLRGKAALLPKKEQPK